MKQIPDHVFRGYDLRGIVESELDEENVEMLGKAYASILLKKRIYDCVVGYDSRESSPRFRDAMVKGLINSGITVYDIGLTLSQIAYFSQYYFRTKGMVMITASHNPKEYNGFKLGKGYSETMETEDIIEYRDLIKANKFTTRSEKGKHIKKDIFSEYVIDILRRVDKIGKYKVVIEGCNATPGFFLPKIFRKVGCQVIEQNTKIDSSFPLGVADPTERDVQQRLADRVVKEKADIGFSYDTDGDRIGIVDEKGNLIWNDVLVSLLTKDALEYAPGSKIVYNTLCSKQVTEVIEQLRGIPVMWKTGHSFIKAKVKEVGAVFGGELSGHIFIVDNFYGHEDGALTALRLMSYLTRKKITLSQAVSKLPHYYSSPEIKLGCADNIKFKTVSDIIGGEIKKIFPKAKYIEIDGVRMDTEKEMIIIRASQNGPYITVKFEAKTQPEYNKLKSIINKILRKVPEVDFKSGVNTATLE